MYTVLFKYIHILLYYNHICVLLRFYGIGRNKVVHNCEAESKENVGLIIFYEGNVNKSLFLYSVCSSRV